MTYESHIKMHTGSGFDDLNWHDDLVYYDGIFYGDVEIFSTEKEIETTSYQEEKSKKNIKENNDESKPAL